MASEAPRPTSSSSGAADSYIGSIISLISRYEIRYEGVLYFLNVEDSTIGLKNVKSYGTEGRKKDGPQVPPSEKEYEYILFRGSDIKDLQVKSSPPEKPEEQLYDDPAIIQTHYTGMPFSSPPVAVGGRSQFQDTPAVISRGTPEETHPYQSGINRTSHHQNQSSNIHASSHFSTSISYNGSVVSPLDGIRHSTPSLSQPSALVPQSSTTSVFTSTSEGITHVPSSVTSFPVHPTVASYSVDPTVASFPVHPSLSSPQTPLQFFNSAVVSSSTPNLPLSPDTSLISFNNLAIPSTITSRAVPDYSMAYTAASFGRPTSGPLLTSPPPSVIAPNQFAQPGYGVLSQMQKLYSNTDKVTAMPAQANIFSISGQTPKEPLLPLPTSAPQRNSSVPFTEEFDFEAMNEKFKKDEVWGALGKLEEKDIAETEDYAVGQSFGNTATDGLAVKPDTTPAYKKDDFFDTISCNSLAQGARTSQNRFSERMKMDSETFGNFRVRPPHQNYGVYSAGRGQNYRGQYSWGRGYGYNGRGNGRYMP